MPPILINVIQGFSAALRPRESTIGHLVKTVLAPFGDEVVINIENSSDRHCIRRSLAFLNRERSHVSSESVIAWGERVVPKDLSGESWKSNRKY